MNLFLNTKLTGLHQNTTLISIALIAENGRSFYAELSDYTKRQITPWITDNIIPALLLQHPKAQNLEVVAVPELAHPIEGIHPYDVKCKGPSAAIKKQLLLWLKQFSKEPITIWGDVVAYNWVLFVKLLATYKTPDMPLLPANIHYIPMDLATLLHTNQIDPDINRYKFSGIKHLLTPPHNALSDAAILKACYDKLKTTTSDTLGSSVL